MYDGAQTGDYCAHFWWDPDAAPYGGAEGHRGEIQMELVDGINVMFGNPNDARVEQQPYILLLGRAPVEQLREEMRRWKAKGEIYADRELKEQKASAKSECPGLRWFRRWQNPLLRKTQHHAGKYVLRDS